MSFWTAVGQNLLFGTVAVGVFALVNYLKAMRSTRADEPHTIGSERSFAVETGAGLDLIGR